jgi:aerobic-type carbon monoxide dehydrogenase small subunit (CoxS/CutS family)
MVSHHLLINSPLHYFLTSLPLPLHRIIRIDRLIAPGNAAPGPTKIDYRKSGQIMPTIKELHVNGSKHPVNTAAERSLLSVLRDDLGLTGSKYGCGEGRCGACTVLLNGQPTRSCTTPLRATQGKKVQTIDGLADKDKLHPLQEAFLKVGAMQCGYCTPGMIMAAMALLAKEPEPSREEIVRFMNGNICRCGTYARIVTAIEQAAKVMNGRGK